MPLVRTLLQSFDNDGLKLTIGYGARDTEHWFDSPLFQVDALFFDALQIA